MAQKLEVGQTLSINHEIIDSLTFETIFAKGESVEVEEVIMYDGYWSRLCPDIYVNPKIAGIRVKGKNGTWSPSTFIMPE